MPHAERALAGAGLAFDTILANLPRLRTAMPAEERHWFEERMKEFDDLMKHFPK
ncbi:MAG: hypothetical protein ACR2I2_14585 [Bryobacteraceae bacterium]